MAVSRRWGTGAQSFKGQFSEVEDDHCANSLHILFILYKTNTLDNNGRRNDKKRQSNPWWGCFVLEVGSELVFSPTPMKPCPQPVTLNHAPSA